MKRVVVSDPQVLVLAAGDTVQAVNNAKGHLFEAFVAKVLARYGYEDPTTRNLNVNSDGVELDVVAMHKLTKSTAIAECKAYSSAVNAQALTSFYGKLVVERFKLPKAHGFFFALPRFTADGVEKSEEISSQDDSFTYLDATAVHDIAKELGIVCDYPNGETLSSDTAIVITSDGVYACHKHLDKQTRKADAVEVWASDGNVPDTVVALLASSSYADELPVTDARAAARTTLRVVSVEDDLVVEVRGSGSDFEYQLPASPKYFIGRSGLVRSFSEVLGQRRGVLVLNAQSGWGKSSVALRLKQEVEGAGGAAVVIDSRTASAPSFVTAALRKAALKAQSVGLCKLPEDASYASIGSSLVTLSQSTWARDGASLLIFFDQFENVFRDAETTRSFRNLALALGETEAPIIIGFAWKTDLVGWTEDHPYQLRDEIRSAAHVINLQPLGAKEVDTLLRRLEKAVGEKLHPDLRSRLREYSQGLPWLLKKFAGHIISEIKGGIDQATLVGEALNIRNLFDADLAQLDPSQTEALKSIARYAPVPASEVMERVPAAVVNSLIDRRLIIQVGEQLDTYWDIFRDFLNTGSVPIEDSYIMRQTPASVWRLLDPLLVDSGDLAVLEIAALLNTSENTVYNLSRELRLMGCLSYAPNRVKLASEIMDAPDREAAIYARVGNALRRHKAYSLFQKLAERNSGRVTVTALARQLPSAFPAVDVTEKTWDVYTRVFCSWFDYAGLASFDSQSLQLPEDGVAIERRVRARRYYKKSENIVFPAIPAGPVVELIESATSKPTGFADLTKKQKRAFSELRLVGAVTVDQDGLVIISKAVLGEDGEVDRGKLESQLCTHAGFNAGLSAIKEDPKIDAVAVGTLVNEMMGGEWTDTGVNTSGRYLRGWARYLAGKSKKNVKVL
ncbi:restriction endonuclease [Lentzea sp. JNUCC 0626]|uniref:nSTAND1 domain-containing NTPase n=1 Tax=Lentzea sp. JNUCC 0626 TaxID=3367513 RepID=UPI0037486AAC